MTPSQIILYASIFIAAAFYVWRKWQLRGLKSYTVQETAERMKQLGPPVLLDVRTTVERQRGGIKGSLHIPLHELGRRIGELEKHKGREIICFCQSGSRSIAAAARLKKSGYNAANMGGGIGEWNLQGLR